MVAGPEGEINLGGPGTHGIEESADRWLTRNFIPECPIRTPGEFIVSIDTRMKEIGNLEADALALRNAVRERLGVSDNNPLVFYGEQPVGLNEPAGPIVGKRLLAHVTATIMGTEAMLLDMRAISDVINSEPGLYRLTVPDPREERGITNIHWVRARKFYQIPAANAMISRNAIDNVVLQLQQIYDSETLRFFDNENLSEIVKGDEINYAEFMNTLLNILLSNLGLQSPSIVTDITLDSVIAQSGGLDLILNHWPEIIDLSNSYNTENLARIPETNEAPFFTFLENQPRLVVKIIDDQNFNAYNPRTKELVTAFSRDDVVNGRVPVCFRAIPRILLYAIISDAHITGGGARYNEFTEKVFEDIFRVPYFPLAWMDLGDKMGLRNLFQYQSAALRNKNELPGFNRALSAVERGEISALDLFLSLPENARELVQQQVFENLENFTMATRIFF